MAILGKITSATVLFGVTLIAAGCAELQQLGDKLQQLGDELQQRAESALPPIDRIQRQLQSQNKQVRMAALDEAANLESQFALQNLILGQALEGRPDAYGHRKVNYPDDVRIGAIDKLFEKGEILTLIKLADDYRIGGGRVAMVKGDNSITSHIKNRIRTVEGLEKLCKECSRLQGGIDWLRVSWILIGTGSHDDQCPLSNECLLWAVRHINDKTMKNIFDLFPRTGMASAAGENAVKRMTDYGCLKTVAMDAACLMQPRIAAAEKMFKHSSINGNDILAVIASFEKADEEQMTQIAKTGLDAAKRIGAQNVVDALEGK